MLSSARLPLGAPGVYILPDAIAPQFNPQHMDVCAFVGVAPRGPAYQPLVFERYLPGYRMMSDPDRPYQRSVPVLVKSFDEYRRLFGGFEGPGYLPYAVAMFFEQGGRRAYIVRVVHQRPSADPMAYRTGWAKGNLAGVTTTDLTFLARNEGSWGNGLRLEMGFSTTAVGFSNGAVNTVLVDRAGLVPVGTLLRMVDATNSVTLAYCRGASEMPHPTEPSSRWQLQFDLPLASAPVRIDSIEAHITVRDNSGQMEAFERLGLTPDHPRSLASVLCNESTLVWPHPDWAATELLPKNATVELLHGLSGTFADGLDQYADLVHDDFFDGNWSAAEDTPGGGVTSLTGCGDLTHVVVPDLYIPAQWAGDETVTEIQTDTAGAEFAPCVDFPDVTSRANNTPPSSLTQLILDPRHSADLGIIARLQQQVLDVCEQTEGMIALLDVPPSLSQGQAERWRAQFDSSWGAAYHPWLIASRRVFANHGEWPDMLRPLPPAAVAAGIVARKEFEHGIQYGPANELASSIINLAETQPKGRADVFHPLGLNCFVRVADGIQLVSARMLSRDRQWRQLSVRRLILMLRRTLLRETQWAVFEPNGPSLWRDLTHAIENLLLRLFRAGAWAGATPAESYFVRVHTEQARLDRGVLLIDVGVAPAEPLEFIVLKLRRDGDGMLTLET